MNKLEKRWKDSDLKLFPHQWIGVEAMEQWLENDHGGICADEMGLGKTCTTIITLTRQRFKKKGPFFVLSPLSVCDHWEREIKRFSGGHLKPFRYTGVELLRQKMLDKLDFDEQTVFITAGHILRQKSTLEVLRHLQKQIPFTTFVIDEAQCVKNPEAQLSRCLTSLIDPKTNPHFILLTGTPIQNNLGELYALLTLADPNKFPADEIDAFSDLYNVPENMPELKEVLKKYMIRRTKDEVFRNELKECEQVILYHGISEIQKEVYKNIVARNAGALRERKASVRMSQLFIELRKCVLHPYIIKGVEPEPWIEGEHLVDASQKLQVLDRLLTYMIPRGHRSLIFSQFLGALDILEDFLRMRGWKYVRITGQTNIEERVEFVDEFQDKNIKDGPVCFLLSTKAGGVGLNLTAADTAIFFDSDWNPQNDIQAMARCHRIGQTKPVKIIRLVARSTIDQYVLAKAREKLKLTDAIIGIDDVEVSALDIADSIQRDFNKLMASKTDKFQCSDEELEKMIGKSEGDLWLPIEKESNVVRFLDPNDQQDIDRNDYTKWEGESHKKNVYMDTWENIVAGSYELPAKRRRSVVNYSTASMIPSIKQMEEAEKQMFEEWKKPRNGYILFIQENKMRIAKENPEMQAQDVLKLCIAEYAKLSEAQRDDYATRAGRVEKLKEPPKSGFGLFRSIEQPALKKQGVTHDKMTKMLSVKWRALSVSQRRKYKDTIISGPQEGGPVIDVEKDKDEIQVIDDEEPDTDNLDRAFEHLGE